MSRTPRVPGKPSGGFHETAPAPSGTIDTFAKAPIFAMPPKPNVFDYIDYRAFLSDWREAQKENDPGLTHAYLSAKLGQKNRTYFSDLEKGRRAIGTGMLERLIRLLCLGPSEGKYFRAIVGFRQSTSFGEREFWFEQAIQLNNTPKRFVDEKTYSFYKKWYYTTIRAYLETCDFRNEYAEASRKLYGRVSPKEVREAIASLKSLGLIAADERGFLKPTDKVVVTGDPVKNELIRRYHLANLGILRSIVEKDEPGTHDGSQLTVSVSRQGIERIVKRIKQLRSEILSIAHKDGQPAERVYKIAIHAFPESRRD
jgi:uncharacterized protein (TIGR02147 family)